MERRQLRSVSVVEALVTALKEDVFRMEYQPGQQITEAELTERYGVSRNTVREAVAILSVSGLLVKEANRGVFVKRIEEADVREIFHFRSILECEAVRNIVRIGVVPDRLIRSMENIEKDPMLRGDWYNFVRSDLDFHAELVHSAQSRRLERLYATIASEIMLCLCQSKNTLMLNPKNIYEHRRFIEVLQERDESAAVKIVTDHILFGIENVARGFHMTDPERMG